MASEQIVSLEGEGRDRPEVLTVLVGGVHVYDSVVKRARRDQPGQDACEHAEPCPYDAAPLVCLGRHNRCKVGSQ